MTINQIQHLQFCSSPFTRLAQTVQRSLNKNVSLSFTHVVLWWDADVGRDGGGVLKDSSNGDVTPSRTDEDLCLVLSTVPQFCPGLASLGPLQSVALDGYWCCFTTTSILRMSY